METESNSLDWESVRNAAITQQSPSSKSGINIPPVLTQFLQYIVVGGVSFVFDFGTLYLCLKADMHYLLGTFFGFCIGLACNFSLCIFWVWKGSNARTLKDFFVFSGIGVAGLLLTSLLMWTFVDLLSLLPTVAKVITAAIVLVWNFTFRKLFVFFH